MSLTSQSSTRTSHPVTTRYVKQTGAHDVKRVLFISYAFPPTGGGGVQRSVKFVKYLPTFGWEPTVLTAANPSVPVQDSDLNQEIETGHANVLRARTFEPSYRVKSRLSHSTSAPGRRLIRRCLRSLAMQVMQPDPQVMWNPAASRAAMRELSERPYDAIYATGPPFSSFLLGRSLKRRTGIPLVIDFRDEWMIANEHLENYSLGRWAEQRHLRMLRSVLRAADAVITTTRASEQEIHRYAEKFDVRPSIQCIYNGYDPDDLAGLTSCEHSVNRLRIVYTGTLWKLTDISPLVTSLKQLAECASTTAQRIELVLIGRRTCPQDALVKQLQSLPIHVECHDYVPHRQALQMASQADVLLLLLADQNGAERVVPAKLFEYMALSKPILAICPDGETDQLLGDEGHIHRFRPQQTEAIGQWLLSRVPQNPSSAPSASETSPPNLRYTREALTEQLAATLRRVARIHRRAPS